MGQILRYYLAEAAAGRVFTIDQFDGKIGLICCVILGTALVIVRCPELEISRSFRMVRYIHVEFLTSNEKYCIGNIKEGVDIRRQN